MKRITPQSPEGPQKRRRQPQVSCDSCRKKKLKCDRGVPCSSCVVRGLSCTGQPPPQKGVAQQRTPAPVPASVPGTDDSILGRLRRLEDAVFGSGAGLSGRESPDPAPVSTSTGLIPDSLAHHDRQSVEEDESYASSQLSSRRPAVDSERQQTAKFLDSTFTRHGLNVTLPHAKMDYHVARVANFPKTPTTTATTPGLTPQSDQDTRPTITWLMTLSEARALLRDFVTNLFHILPILHVPATSALIESFYASLSLGSEPPDQSHAALILAIAGTSAFFYAEGSEAHQIFASADDATRTAMSWFRSALAALNPAQPPPASGGRLAEVQARSILAYLMYNFEGCSARFRFLHSCSLSAAKEGCLHLIDSPAFESRDDVPTREIKRRVWWHIVSTDWMLGLMGGPIDGTYAIHPRHMNVNQPRNINDDEASLADEFLNHPPSKLTTTACFIRRIQLADIARRIIDARDPQSPEAEITDLDKVTTLDLLFADALASFPPFLRPEGPLPADAPRHFALQRDVVLLGFHSRRARLHRPFLLRDDDDAACRSSRDTCLTSARVVLSVALRILRGSQAREPSRGDRMGCRLGCVVGHMFMACTILALNAGHDTGREAVAPEAGGAAVDATTETHAEVAEACGALAAFGEESAVAARLVQNLVGVLRRYRVQGLDEVVVSDDADKAPGLPDPKVETDRGRDTAEEGESTADYAWMLNNNTETSLDGLWDGIIGDGSTAFGWDQLFADLDPYCGV
ncbi:hypothetical protein CSOJ01_12180 [Colletotrichum sojae]|uniref:Zn(2)-C6 fungal-type domain-containing protein n=1 Tax=Colletotrichum sojae TaxID=2175907 RepID=A0A8H6IW09_9PEZI|nr:hypothetical protein CSOJ01_12180 [Colletotrichum sojae]